MQTNTIDRITSLMEALSRLRRNSKGEEKKKEKEEYPKYNNKLKLKL